MSEVRIATPEDMKTMALPTIVDPTLFPNRNLSIQYGTLPEQLLDVYRPEKYEGKLPVLIYVHGGAWSMGNRYEGALENFMVALQRGYAVIAMDYRLAPSVQFPEFLYDVKTAVRWAYAHADEYDLDTERFCMVGDSAGAHLTLMIATTAGVPELEGAQYGWAEYPSSVKAACGMYTPAVLYADEEAWYRESGAAWLVFRGPDSRDMMETAFGGHDTEKLKAASPITYITKDMPPVLLEHGYLDSIVPYQNSTEFKKKADEVCGEDRVVLEVYPERNHSDKAFMTDEHGHHVLDFFDSVIGR